MHGQVVRSRNPHFASSRICSSMLLWCLSSEAKSATSGPASRRTFRTKRGFQSGTGMFGRMGSAHRPPGSDLAKQVIRILQAELDSRASFTRSLFEMPSRFASSSTLAASGGSSRTESAITVPLYRRITCIHLPPLTGKRLRDPGGGRDEGRTAPQCAAGRVCVYPNQILHYSKLCRPKGRMGQRMTALLSRWTGPI